MAEKSWNGVDRRCCDDRRKAEDRRSQERNWERRSGEDRRGHPLYARRSPEKLAS